MVDEKMKYNYNGLSSSYINNFCYLIEDRIEKKYGTSTVRYR